MLLVIAPASAVTTAVLGAAQVGLIRIVMSLEDQGPAGITAATVASSSKAQQQRQQQQQQHNVGTSKVEIMADLPPVPTNQSGRRLQPKDGGVQPASGADAV